MMATPQMLPVKSTDLHRIRLWSAGLTIGLQRRRAVPVLQRLASQHQLQALDWQAACFGHQLPQLRHLRRVRGFEICVSVLGVLGAQEASTDSGTSCHTAFLCSVYGASNRVHGLHDEDALVTRAQGLGYRACYQQRTAPPVRQVRGRKLRLKLGDGAPLACN